ncbi:MAG: DUF2851 family protein [Planctomycetes bacterium]|nr:DUF2851 family protein [Planctomycetota bacterium]
MRERDLQFAWERRLFRQEGLLTEDARPLVVVFPGVRSVEGGPDFRGAVLRIDGRSVAGDVELHLTTDGWRAHGHGRDGAYDSVVLHVALERGKASPGGIAEMILAPYLDPAIVAEEESRIDRDELGRLGDTRFDRRVARLRRLLAAAHAAEVFYREVMIALGYKHNRAPFEELARLVPLPSLRGLPAEGIEARLRGAARGLAWRRRGVRPANRPERRIAGAARWLACVGTEAPHVPHLARPARPFAPGFIGSQRQAELVANVVLPMAVAAGSPEEAAAARDAFATLPSAPPNRRTKDGRAFSGAGRPGTLREEWGLMEWRDRFPHSHLAPRAGVC